MDYYDKLIQWQEYADILYPLRDEVDNIFKIHYIWDAQCNCEERLYVPDEDTVFLLKLSEKLNDICYFLKSHISVLELRVDIEEEIRSNQEQAFEAWKRGLCPVLMRNVQRYVKPPKYDAWGTYDEVAVFLTSNVISYEGTQKAVRAWELAHSKLNAA